MIIAILAGLLLPALNAVRGKARCTYCLNNQKQCGLALNSYCDSWDGVYPVIHGGTYDAVVELDPEPQWYNYLPEYGLQPQHLRCPEDPAVRSNFNETAHSGAEDYDPAIKWDTRQSYMINAMYTFNKKRDKLRNTSSYIMLVERGGDQEGTDENSLFHQCYHAMGKIGDWETRIEKKRHAKAANYLFADGHASTLRFEETIGSGGDDTAGRQSNRHFIWEWGNDQYYTVE